MTRNAKPTGLSVSIPAGLAAGGMMSLGVTVAGTAVLAKLLDMNWMDQGKIGYAIMVMIILASWLGAITAADKIKRRRLLCCALAGCVYYGTLLAITALLFGGQYSGAGETALLVICGSMLGILLRFPAQKSPKRGKTKTRNR